MFTKVCRGFLSARIAVKTIKRDRIFLNLNQCYSNRVTCHPAASQGSYSALVPHCTQWTAKRFRTQVAPDKKGVGEIPNSIGNARTQRRRNQTKQSDKGVSS